jgi:hypothetical protein
MSKCIITSKHCQSPFAGKVASYWDVEFEEYPDDGLRVNDSLDPAPSEINDHLFVLSEHRKRTV